MSNKLWVDDIRTSPPGWIWAKNYDEAVEILDAENIDLLSLDHDLGDDEKGTGYSIACFLEARLYLEGKQPPKTILIHSANPVGRSNIERAIGSMKRYITDSY